MWQPSRPIPIACPAPAISSAPGSWPREYGVNDADGSRPDWGTYFGSILPAIGHHDSTVRYAAFLERMTRRARAYLDIRQA